MKITAALLAFAAATTPGLAADIQPLIFGGKPVPVGQKTYTVGLRETELSENFCGGVLISPTHVLTAAHCGGNKAKFLSIGSHFVSGAKGGERLRVKRELRHPKYNADTFTYDYALLELATPSTFPPVALSTADTETLTGQSATVLGWGLTTRNGKLSTNLLRVDVPVVSNTVCTKSGLSYAITETMLCAGAEFNKDACQGDSGGPLILEQGQQDVLIGVVSWGDLCGVKGQPGVYAKVAAVKSWIQTLVPKATFV